MIRLSELVSSLTPSCYAELALLLFAAAFAAVVIRHGGSRRAAEHAHCAVLPLTEDSQECP